MAWSWESGLSSCTGMSIDQPELMFLKELIALEDGWRNLSIISGHKWALKWEETSPRSCVCDGGRRLPGLQTGKETSALWYSSSYSVLLLSSHGKMPCPLALTFTLDEMLKLRLNINPETTSPVVPLDTLAAHQNTGLSCSIWRYRSCQPNTIQAKKGSFTDSSYWQLRELLSQQWLYVCLAPLHQFILSNPMNFWQPQDPATKWTYKLMAYHREEGGCGNQNPPF